MKVYVDLLFLLNVYLDFFILLTTSLILKRNVSLKRIFLGSLVGGLTIVLLFFKISNIGLFFLKFLFSVLMVLVTFSFKDIKYFFNNLGYLYVTSIVLGGGLYLVDLEFNLNSIIFILVISVIVLYIYGREINKLKYNYNNYLNVEIEYKKNKFKYVGYVDSGNKLRDPYKNRPVSLIYCNDFKYEDREIIYVPYETASGSGLLKCIRVDKLIIDDKTYKNSLIGFMDNKIKIDGVDIILNNEYIGGK